VHAQVQEHESVDLPHVDGVRFAKPMAELKASQLKFAAGTVHMGDVMKGQPP